MLRYGADCEHETRDVAANGSDDVRPASFRPLVFSLIECPPLGPGNFALVKRDETGRAALLALGHLGFLAPALNLALVRRRGATLDAGEVHYWGKPASGNRRQKHETV